MYGVSWFIITQGAAVLSWSNPNTEPLTGSFNLSFRILLHTRTRSFIRTGGHWYISLNWEERTIYNTDVFQGGRTISGALRIRKGNKCSFCITRYVETSYKKYITQNHYETIFLHAVHSLGKKRRGCSGGWLSGMKDMLLLHRPVKIKLIFISRHWSRSLAGLIQEGAANLSGR
jgi:hypothetical protein